MKKFSKILFLLLSVVAIVAAFTVVALATETPEPYEYPYYDSTFSKYDAGTDLSYGRDAHAVITVQDNGNKYVLAKDNPNSTASDSQWDISYQDYISTDYNLIDYPYFMLDFDIMTRSGSYSGHSWNPRLYNSNTSVGFIGGTYLSNGLSTKPYDWRHVSLIVEYKGSGNFTIYYYVNGAKVSSFDKTISAVTTVVEKTTRVCSMKLYPSTSSEVGYDNMKFTHFPAGYYDGNVDLIANHNYSKYGVVDGYGFPPGKTVAKLIDNETGEITYYDDYEKALADKNENNTLESDVVAKITANGKNTYVTQDDFASEFAAMPDGAKMVLIEDVVLYKALTFNEARTTELDLNGHKIYRLGTEYTDFRAVLNEDGTYGKGEALTSPAAVAGGYLFTMNALNTNFTLSSSAPGAKIYSATIAAERLLLEDGTVVGSVSASIPKAIEEFGDHYKEIFRIASKNISLTIKGDITTISDSLITSSSDASNFNLHINGGTYVKALRHTNGLLYLDCGGTVLLENATFSASGNWFFRNTYTNNPCTLTANNCTFIGGHIQANDTAGKYTITNSKFYGINSIAVAGSCLAGDRTWFNKEYTAIGKLENNKLIQKTKTVTYTLPNNSLSIDPVTLLPYETTYTTKLTYSCVTLNESTDYATVTWLDRENNTIKTDKVIKGDTVTAPTGVKVPMPNGYGSFTNPYWIDGDGNKTDFTIGELDSYTFKPSTEVPAEPKLVAYIDEVLFNLTYSDMFVYRLYVPVVEGVDVTGMSGYDKNSPNFKKYMISGKEYYGCVVSWNPVRDAVEDTLGRVYYTLNGTNYIYDVNVSALLYANLLCGDTTGNINQIEKNAMFDMMAYLEQVYALAGKLTAHQDKFDTFFATHYEKGNGKARPAFDVNTQTVYEINNDFKKYVASTQYALHAGGRLSFGVTLMKGYVDHTVTSALTGFDQKIAATTETVIDPETSEEKKVTTSYTYYTKNNGYTTVMKDDYLIQVQDAGEKVVATQSYNLATYRAGLAAALAKNPEAANANELKSAINLVDSIYTFGNAIAEVYSYLNKL